MTGTHTLAVRHFIGGEWSSEGSAAQRENPSDTRDIVTEFHLADRATVDRAVQAAAAAQGGWSVSTPQQRFDVLDRIGSEILARREELGHLLAREEGKVAPEAIGEVARAGQIFKFFAGEALRIPGETLASVRPGVQVDITREPVGVVGLITPWNFPFAIPAWKIAPALAYGNSVVFKPGDPVPACGAALAEIISRAGLPAGVFNCVIGRGDVAGQALVDHPLVDAVSFTGSQATGAKVLHGTAARGARAQLEMGGKNALVVLADADLDLAVDCALQGAFYSTGQRCTASSRLIVASAVHDTFVERLLARLTALRIGGALDAGTDIGPVVDQRQFDSNLGHLAHAREEGVTTLHGGERCEAATPGWYMRPALLAAQPHHRIAQVEVFGPVACVLRVEDYEQALALTNDSPYGLCAGICTTSLAHATHFRRHARVGMTMVNLPTAGVDFHVPFGGRKGSSYGPREQGRYAVEFYTAVKTGYMRAL